MAAAEILAVLQGAALEAGAELRRRFDGPRTVSKKGAIDLVTDADRAAEEIVLRRLSRELPDAAVVAEESGRHEGRGSLRVYVDPLDGTTNFAGRLPHFAVTLAAEDEGGLAAGVVYDPMRDELFSASRGGGAFRGAERLRVAGSAALEDALLVTGFPYDLRSRPDELLDLFRAFLLRARAVRRFGSAALDLAWVAAGRFDGFWESGLKPWDVAAGILLVREAQGAVTDYRGGEPRLEGGEIVAANLELARAMVAITHGLAR